MLLIQLKFEHRTERALLSKSTNLWSSIQLVSSREQDRDRMKKRTRTREEAKMGLDEVE